MTDTAIPDEDRSEKDNVFTGVWAGAGYLVLTKVFGFTRSFYEKALGNLDLPGDLTVLDLGCGPGTLSFPLGRRLSAGSALYGIDLSADQIRYADEQSRGMSPPMHFSVCSMDELPFRDAMFNVVVTSMALHEASIPARQGAIAEVARVLKPEGRFLLIDWSKPRFGLMAAVWLPFLLFGKKNTDNWNNVYKEYCQTNGMELREDAYVNSIVRRQVYRKGASAR